MINVEYIDHMGSDTRVADVARVSFNHDGRTNYEGQVASEKDAKLIRYLASHGHWTPFAHCLLTLRITAPVFVRTQLFKHKVGLVENEVSRRYVDEDPEFFMPTEWRGRPKNKKQGSSDTIVTSVWCEHEDVGGLEYIETPITPVVESLFDHTLWVYKAMIKGGVAPEQARMILPQSMMTKWIWTGSLAAYARVCNLRLKADTQQETREFADRIYDIMKPLWPVSVDALVSKVEITKEQ